MSFDAEFSVILARAADGETSAFPLTRNHHEGGILRTSTVPAGAEIEAMPEAEAIAAAKAIADALDHVGVLTVEFFACAEGAGGQRDGPAGPQQRPLDDRGRPHLAVRTASPRHPRPAARRSVAGRARARRWRI